MCERRWIGGLKVNHIAPKKSKGGGQSPQFKMCIEPVLKLKEQLDAMAAEEGIY